MGGGQRLRFLRVRAGKGAVGGGGGGTQGSRQGAARAGRRHRQGKRREQVRGSAGAIMLRGSISDRGCQIEQKKKKRKENIKKIINRGETRITARLT